MLHRLQHLPLPNPVNTTLGRKSAWKRRLCHSEERGRQALAYPKSTNGFSFPPSWGEPGSCPHTVPMLHCLFFKHLHRAAFPCGSSLPWAPFSRRQKAALLPPFWSRDRGEGARGGGCSGNSHPYAIGLLFKMLSSTAHGNPAQQRLSLRWYPRFPLWPLFPLFAFLGGWLQP